ncbi:CAP domain-containing protein [Deinococcus radiodurans]|jgi:Uncharacterized protein with SCP/PR1 domains|uniref:SCP domain-containing protein n=2 Tax=Deinococcus radiodurans TaxID=1299 RepID=Q9RR94_DEIRA|nr:CAP domain-containing protein [Deinococcus radiodurans]AAF12144.1 hypothetical protein DR_2600 [Deinococcus radiodurans R1 = ATCC 13939 = DSM 20539]ANC70382.1 hypothetical protein A2G07_00585 [Deinococcus radiodurans R1 = ATCC 13939 = DSM 20539]QEM71947.1 CAP domain-containing protein [Deinococcus radiodurans]UDL01590.1 CAP domain-containing protein [Deinococcus radiodurans R1 = ATCC 13939 = DSM 20539]UID71552.1 hypothetical protein DRO_2571 [Deinococcus radiodurans R1 = ATCC 13939 = DSM 20
MRRLSLLLVALLGGVAPLARAQVQVIPFPGPAPAPVAPAPAPVPPPPPSAPAAAPALPVAPAPAPVAQSTCAPALPALHLAAADIAAGADAYRAVTNRAGAPSQFRYWKVSPAQLPATVRELCQRGFVGYGTAPSGSLMIVLGARWPGGTPAEASAPASPVAAAPAPVAAAPVVLAPAAPAPAAPAPSSRPPTSPTLSSPPVTAAAPAAPVPGPLGELLAGINAARTQGRRCGGVQRPPVPPLVVDARLSKAAQEHAEAMVAQGFAEHVNPRTRSTPESRARAQGFSGRVSENIRYGTPTVDGALIWWLGSAVHCTSLMSRDWTHMGAGSAVQNDQSSFWVLVLGRE